MNPIRPKIARWMRKRGWSYDTPRSGVRSRLVALMDHRPWWDWGHMLMVIAGDNDCGNWSDPEPPTWYYGPWDGWNFYVFNNSLSTMGQAAKGRR